MEITDSYVKEIKRDRIPAPQKIILYCEKTGCPFLINHIGYVKWGNPVEIVEYNPETKNQTTSYW